MKTQAAKVNAAILKAGTYIFGAGTTRGKVLDVEDASKKAGANVIIWAYSGAANQKWRVKYVNGYAVIYGIGGNVLSVKGSKARDGANVRMAAYKEGAKNQRWTVKTDKKGNIYLVSALNANYRLSIAKGGKKDGANVVLGAKANVKAQKWGAYSTKPKVAASAKVASGWYALRSKLNSRYYLDVTDIGTKNGTPLELWQANDTPAQLFRFIKVGKYYRIETGDAAGKYLDIQDGRVLPGATADIWKTKADRTLYSLQYDKKLKGYRLVNVATGLALSAYSGKAANGTQVTGEKPAAVASQTFILVKRSGLLKDGFYRMNTMLEGKRAVSVKDGSLANGGKIVVSNYLKGLNQKWQVAAVSGKNNTYTFENIQSGKRLTGAKNTVSQKVATTNGTQYWVPSWSKGGYVLKNAATGQVLDVSGGTGENGTQVLGWEAKSKDNANQRFTFKKVTVLESGVYEFLSMKDNAYALDLSNADDSDGANVGIAKRDKTAKQRWLYDAKTGTLTAVSSGKMVDVDNASKKSGTNVLAWTANGGNNQKWTISYQGGGTFKVSSQLGGSLVLTATKAAQGGNATSAKDGNTALQNWRLVSYSNIAPVGFNLITSIISQGHGKLNASYVVIHETANPGATAKNHRDYWNDDDTYAVHYTLDWTGDCYYCVPENRLCWQVGGGNKYVVGIELCHALNQSDFNKVYNGGVQWAAWQLAKNGWGVNRLISHNECRVKWGGTDHTDPDDYFEAYGKSWSQFKTDVATALAKR